MPPVQIEDQVDEELAQAIAEKIAPTPKQTVRKELLQKILWYWDSLTDTQGEAAISASLRVGLASISKAIKPLAPYMSSPIDLICHRDREFFPNGSYRATIYTPTSLGVRVREILLEQGKIK